MRVQGKVGGERLRFGALCHGACYDCTDAASTKEARRRDSTSLTSKQRQAGSLEIHHQTGGVRGQLALQETTISTALKHDQIAMPCMDTRAAKPPPNTSPAVNQIGIRRLHGRQTAASSKQNKHQTRHDGGCGWETYIARHPYLAPQASIADEEEIKTPNSNLRSVSPWKGWRADG